MKNFSYRSGTDDEINFIQTNKKKINKQALIYKIIFVLFVLSIIAYYVYRMYFVNYDGFVKLNVYNVSLSDDSYLIKTNVNIGDTVKAGDTLFTFLLTNQISNKIKPETFMNIENQYIDYNTKFILAEKELHLLETQRDEIYSELMKTNEGLLTGTATEKDITSLNTQISSINYKITLKKTEISLYDSIKDKYIMPMKVMKGSRLAESYSLAELQGMDTLFDLERKYFVAKLDAIVIDVSARDASFISKASTVMTCQPLNNDKMNLHIDALVFPDDIDYLYEGKEVEIIATNKHKYKGHVVLIGAMTQIIPNNLKSNFSDKVNAIVVNIHFDDNQELPFWLKSDNLPVVIRTTKKERK